MYMMDRILVWLINQRQQLHITDLVRVAHCLAGIGHADLMTDSLYDMIVASCRANIKQLGAVEFADLLWALGR